MDKVFALAGPFEERATPHRFRHTFVRILLEKGVPVADVAELIGDTEDMVRRHYARWVPERQARLTNILKQAFEDKPKPKVLPLVIPDRVYVPFELKENSKRLHIRTVAQGSLYPSYHYLRDMRFGHDLESIFTLIYTFMIVEVTGQHLAPIVDAINSEDSNASESITRNSMTPRKEERPSSKALTSSKPTSSRGQNWLWADPYTPISPRARVSLANEFPQR